LHCEVDFLGAEIISKIDTFPHSIITESILCAEFNLSVVHQPVISNIVISHYILGGDVLFNEGILIDPGAVGLKERDKKVPVNVLSDRVVRSLVEEPAGDVEVISVESDGCIIEKVISFEIGGCDCVDFSVENALHL